MHQSRGFTQWISLYTKKADGLQCTPERIPVARIVLEIRPWFMGG
jgi:hypothetical protein